MIYGRFISTPGREADRMEPAVVSLKGDKIVVRGRGIIDGSKCPLHTRSILGINGNDIHVEGIIVRDSSRWTIPIGGSERLTLSNVKVFGWRSNSDGIDICGSRNVEIVDCYLRTWDDLIVVKTNDISQGESRNIVVQRCVLWNEVAHALTLGAELRKNVEHVLFRDCDVIRDKGREWSLRVYHCDSAWIKDITFENIRIEESQRFASLWIGSAVWSAEASVDTLTMWSSGIFKLRGQTSARN